MESDDNWDEELEKDNNSVGVTDKLIFILGSIFEIVFTKPNLNELVRSMRLEKFDGKIFYYMQKMQKKTKGEYSKWLSQAIVVNMNHPMPKKKPLI